MSLNTKYLVIKWVLSTLKCTKIDFGQGSVPDPTGGAYDVPPDPLVGWGGVYPLPTPLPLDAFGVSISIISGSG